MLRSFINPKGNALIITLIVSMVLLISVMGITATIATGSLRTGADQGITNRAQFAAESGLARPANLAQVNSARTYLGQLKIDFSVGNTDATALATLTQQMYQFCTGITTTPPTSFNIKPVPIPADGVFLCGSSGATAVNTSQTDSQIGSNRLAIIVNNIANSVYPTTLTSTSGWTAAGWWGSLAKGAATAVTMNTTSGLSDRYTSAIDFSPFNIFLDAQGNYTLMLGNPNRGIRSVGEVVDSSGKVLASKTISQGLTPISVRLNAPGFASFAWFYNSHRMSTNTADTAYNQATQITSDLRINGPAFTNGRFVFASGATPQFRGSFGSAGCENGVQKVAGADVCTKATAPLTEAYHVGGLGAGTTRAVTTATQASGLTNITPTLIKTNDQGQELCMISGVEAVCTSSAQTRVTDVNWNRSSISMPTTAITTFRDRAQTNGLSVNSTDFTAPWTAGWRSFTSFNNICIGGTPPNSSQPCIPLPTDAQNGIGRFEGRPTITLSIDPTTGMQRIRVSANITKGYQLALSPDCGGGGVGGGGGGGTLGTDAPSLRKFWTHIQPKLRELSQALGSALTFSSTAIAQATYSSTWRCTWGTRNGQTPNSWSAYWTQSEGDGNRVRYNTTTNRPVTSGGVWNADTQGNVDMVYEVDDQNRIRLVSNNSSTQTSTQTWPASLSGRVPPALVTAPTGTTGIFGAANFNGVLFRGREATVGSGNWVDGNMIVEGDGTAAADVDSANQITIATGDTLYVNNDITYQTAPTTVPQPKNLLGLYARDDVMITTWDRNAAVARNIDGVLMAETGSVRVGGHDWEGNNGRDVTACNYGADFGNLNIRGSLIQNTLGAMNCRLTDGSFRGYRANYTYDQRMAQGSAPPAFPTFGAGVFNATAPSGGNASFWRMTNGN